MADRKPYVELLRDPRWQKKRLEILNRSDFHCEGCGREDRTLHVHHRLYRKGAKPWEYADTELDALCEECHASISYEMAQISELLAMVPQHQIDFQLLRLVITGFLCGFLPKGKCGHITDWLGPKGTRVEAWKADLFIGIVKSIRSEKNEAVDHG